MTDTGAADEFTLLGEVVMHFAELDRWRKLIPSTLRPGSEVEQFLEPLLTAMAANERALIEFLYGRDGKRDNRDLAASDFVLGWNEQPSGRAVRHLKLFDEHVAHLTRARPNARMVREVMEVGPLADELLEVARSFMDRLPPRFVTSADTWAIWAFEPDPPDQGET